MNAKDLSSLGIYLKGMLKEHFTSTSSLQEKSEISDVEMESLYAKAYSFYQEQKSREACEVFGFLIAFNPYSQMYWLGLAASQHQGKEYEKALHAYALASLLDDQDPAPHYHAAQVYLELQNEKEATKALNLAEALANQNPQHQFMKERIMKLKTCFKNKDCHGSY